MMVVSCDKYSESLKDLLLDRYCFCYFVLEVSSFLKYGIMFLLYFQLLMKRNNSAQRFVTDKEMRLNLLSFEEVKTTIVL